MVTSSMCLTKSCGALDLASSAASAMMFVQSNAWAE